MLVWEVSISQVFPGKEYPSYQEAAWLHVFAHFRWHLCISVYKGTILILHNLDDS